MIVKCSMAYHSQNMLLWYINILWCRHLKNSKCKKRLSLNSPYLPKDRSSRRNSIVKNPLPGSFFNSLTSEDGLITGGEWSQRHTQTKVLHKLSYFQCVLLRVHSSFLEVTDSALRDLHPPYPFLVRWYLLLNFKPPGGEKGSSP